VRHAQGYAVKPGRERKINWLIRNTALERIQVALQVLKM
jgi:hypothetical protein